jgi:hypothetical protein
MTDYLRIRRGSTGDTDTIIGMIDEAADWLRGKGADQWARPWPNRAARDGRVRRGLRNRHTWIAEAAGRPIATITYRPHSNQKLWTERECHQPAVYISRLVVSRCHVSDGIYAGLIDWVGQFGARGWNAEWIRMDVWTSHDVLQAYYERQGFTHMRTCEFNHPWEYPSSALFQKPTADINVAATTRFPALE